ncbi:hypothetical protein ACVXHA_01265 [Escherichia coli]
MVDGAEGNGGKWLCRSRGKPAWIGRYRELKRRWRAKRGPVFRCSDESIRQSVHQCRCDA